MLRLRIPYHRIVLLFALAAGLSACGGGASRSTPPGTSGSLAVAAPGASAAPRSSTAANLTVSFQIPAVPTSSATLQALKRKPAFVSSGTEGVALNVYLHTDTAHANPLASGVYDVSSGSSTCTGSTLRTCALSIGVSPPAAGAAVDLVVTLYASAPVNGAFPANATILGTGTLAAQTIVANTQNLFTISVLGVPAAASISFAPPGTATRGQSATLPLVVTVFDATGATIEGSYATPLTLTTSDTSGATSFTVNGKAGATIAASTDTADLVYSGASLSTATIGLTGTGVSAQTIAFAPGASAPTISATTLTLSQESTTGVTITVSEAGYAGSFTPSGCSGMVTVTPQTAAGGSQTFTLAAGASTGACFLTFTDTNAQVVNVNITITGTLMASPTTLNFVSGTTTAKTFTVMEPVYSGTFTVSSSCGSIATVSPATATGTPSTFTVTPGAAGTCQITVHDSLGNSTIVTATVANPLVISPTSVSLPTNGSESSTFTISEAGYTGSFSVEGAPGCSFANVFPVSASGPSATITVTRIGTASGTCALTVMDAVSQIATVTVTAPRLQTPTLTPSSLTMPTNGTTTASFTVSESGYTGTFTNTGSTCGSLVSLSAGTGSAGSTPYTLTRGSGSGSCQIDFIDGYGQTVIESVTIPSLAVPALSGGAAVTVPGPATATFTESGYTGSATYTTTCQSATLSSTSTTGSPASINVTSSVPQTCSLQALDAYGQEATGTLTFTSAVGPLTASPATLTVAVGANGTITVSDPGLSGTITASSSPCANVATVSPGSTSGATGTFTVTGVAAGSCTLSFGDSAGNPATTVAVTVVTPQITITPGTAGTNQFTESLPINGQTSLAITASETGYSGTFSIMANTCTSTTLPSVSPTSGATTFTLNRPLPSTTATNCEFNIVDSNSNAVEVRVTAPAPNALSLSYSNITLAANATFSATESGYTYGSGFTVTNGCASAGITINGLGLSNGTETFSLNNGGTGGNGTCSITISDAYGQSQSISVTYLSSS